MRRYQKKKKRTAVFCLKCAAGRMNGRDTETSAHFPGGSNRPQHVGHSGRMQMQKRNEDLRFHSACEAPAIILIWSCPEGSYYGIYFNSRGLLHFFCTGQRRRKKKKSSKRSEECARSLRQCTSSPCCRPRSGNVNPC